MFRFVNDVPIVNISEATNFLTLQVLKEGSTVLESTVSLDTGNSTASG